MNNTKDKQACNQKMILLGFDGGSWNVINPLLEEGKLPNIRKLMDKGVYAKLQTPPPNFTPIIWTTILSGFGAKRHGIKNFFNTSQDLLVPRLWDVIMHENKSAGVVGHYFTFPINPKFKFCIPSHFDPDVMTLPNHYSYIRELTRCFEAKDFSVSKLIHYTIQAIKYGLSFKTAIFTIRSILSALLNKSYLNYYHRFQRVFMDFSFNIFLHAYQKHQPDFASFYTPLPDTICHKYWSFHEPQHFNNTNQKQIKLYGDVIRDTYIHLDNLVGKLLQSAQQNTQICIVSDHGFKRMETPHDRIVVVPEKLTKILDPENKLVITNLGHQVLVQPKNNSIDLIDKTLEVLRNAYLKDSNLPLFNDVDKEDDLTTIHFWINFQNVNSINTKIVIDEKEVSMSDIAKIGSTWTGEHHMEEGIFFLSGPGVIQNGKHKMIKAVNVCPTLLRLQNCPISEELDGTIIEDIIDPNWARENPIKTVNSYGNIEFKPGHINKSSEEEIKNKLKSLGYM